MSAELPGYQDWFPYRELLTLLQSNLHKSKDEHDENLQLSEIKTLLTRQKSDLLSSYTHKSSAAKIPDDFAKSGLVTIGNSQIQLKADQINEIRLLIKIFSYPKIEDAIKLVVTSQVQLEEGHLTFWARGLIAVFHHFEHLEYQSQVLKLIFETAFQYKNSLESTLLTDIIIDTAEDLIGSHGIFMKIFNTLGNITLANQLTSLEKEYGLGDERHRFEIKQKVLNTRNNLADCVSLICRLNDAPLEQPLIGRMLKELNRVNSMETDKEVTYKMLTGIVAYIDRLSTEFQSNIPLITSFHEAIQDIIDKQTSSFEVSDNSKGLISIVVFAWSVALRKLSLNASEEQTYELQQITERDESFLDSAVLDFNVLSTFRNLFTSQEKKFSKLFSTTFHKLFKDLICYQNIWVKECRKLAITKSTFAETDDRKLTVFPKLLTILGDFYVKTAGLPLGIDFLNFNQSDRDQFQHILFEFVRQSGETSGTTFFIEYCHFLTGIVTEDSALQVFQLASNLSGKINLCSVFKSLVQYANSLKISQANSNVETPILNPNDVEALTESLELIAACAEVSEGVRSNILDVSVFQFYQTFTTLIQCRIPLNLKSKVLKVISAVSKQSEATQRNIIELMSTGNIYGNILSEYEKPETEAGDFPVTLGQLDFFLTLNNLTPENEQLVHDCFLVKIFTTLSSKTVKSSVQKAQLHSKILSLIYKILTTYKPKELISQNFQNSKVPIGQKLMVSLLDPTNKIFKSIMNIISTGLVGLKVPPGEYPCEETAECVYKAVQILMQVAEKSVLMINLAKNCDSAPSITSFDKVLLAFNPHTMKADHLYNTLSLLTIYNWLPGTDKIVGESVKLIAWFCKNAFGHMEKALVKSVDNVILYSFVEIVEAQTKLSATLLKSIVTALSFTHYGVGKMLAEMVVGLARHGFENPSMEHGRFLVHSCLSMVEDDAEILVESGDFTFSELKELSYELLYRLAGSTRSGRETLKYLRGKDFIVQKLDSFTINNMADVKSLSWLLKISSLEVYISNRSNANDRVVKVTNAITSSNFVSRMFDVCKIYNTKPDPPSNDQLQVFDLRIIQTMVGMCQEPAEIAGGNECRLINIEKFFELIDSEIKPNMSNITREIKANIDSELKILMQFLSEYNECQTSVNATNMAVNGFRQVLETVLTLTNLEYQNKQELIVSLVDILNSIVAQITDNTNNTDKNSTLNASASQNLAALAVTITSKLKTISHQARADGHNTVELFQIANQTGAILEKLFKWLLLVQDKRKTKTYVLTTCLYFIELCEENNDCRNLSVVLQKTCQNPTLLHNVINDICEGHAITRSLSCTLLAKIQSYDTESSSLVFMTKNGYLNNLVSTLGLLDDEIVKSLYGGNMGKDYYIFTSICNLLVHISNLKGAKGCRQLVEAYAIDTLTSLKFLQNCATIGEASLYKMYAMPVLKTIASIATGLEQTKNEAHLGNSIVLERVRGLLSRFIETNCDIFIEFLKPSENSKGSKNPENPKSLETRKRMQFYLLQIILYGAFTSTSEINTAIWPQHTRILGKILDLLKNSNIVDEDNLQHLWIVTQYARRLIQSQINSCKDISIHWDMLKQLNHQPSLKLFIDLLEPISRRLSTSKTQIDDFTQKINNIDELNIQSLEKITGRTDLDEIELRQMADEKLSEKLKSVQSNLPLSVAILENSVFVIMKTLEFYTEPMITAKQRYQTYGNKDEMGELCSQMKAVLTEGCFSRISEAVSSDGLCPSVFVSSNIRELQHLMIKV